MHHQPVASDVQVSSVLGFELKQAQAQVTLHYWNFVQQVYCQLQDHPHLLHHIHKELEKMNNEIYNSFTFAI